VLPSIIPSNILSLVRLSGQWDDLTEGERAELKGLARIIKEGED
jgi:hypothetical protein